jgi:hypothetical protein
MNKERLKESLKRRLDLARENRHQKHYLSAVLEYHWFIGDSLALKPVISRLISQDKIAPTELQEMFNDFLFHQSLTRFDPKPILLQLPTFYTQEVEEKYRLYKKHLGLYKIDAENPDIYTQRITLDPNTPVIYPKDDSNFYFLEKLFMDIAETLDEMDEQSDEENKLHKFPFKIPSGTKWGNIMLQFLDTENAFIIIKGTKHRTNFSEMGFVDKRNKKPDNQWSLLYSLAKHGGELTWQDVEATDKNKKRKQLLTEQLQNYFKMDTDPFHPYSEGKAYRIKMTVMLQDGTEEEPKNKESDIMEGSPFN